MKCNFCLWWYGVANACVSPALQSSHLHEIVSTTGLHTTVCASLQCFFNLDVKIMTWRNMAKSEIIQVTSRLSRSLPYRGAISAGEPGRKAFWRHGVRSHLGLMGENGLSTRIRYMFGMDSESDRPGGLPWACVAGAWSTLLCLGVVAGEASHTPPPHCNSEIIHSVVESWK